MFSYSNPRLFSRFISATRPHRTHFAMPAALPYTSSSSSRTPQPSQPPPSPPAVGETTASSPRTALPAPGDELAVPLPVGGAVKLGDLGPLVVNEDGTVSRIANWAEMTAAEKDTTIKVLSKRNKKRLATLGRKPPTNCDDAGS